MARNQKLSYKMNIFHFLTKQNYSKYSQISMSMSFSSSEASTMFRSSTASFIKYSHFEIEHELSEERILIPSVTSSK